MVEQTHGKRLLSSIASWNTGRKEHREIRPDLRDAHFSKANLRDAHLSFTHLSGANLSGANLSFAHLSGANLSFADLSGANLSGANLRDADLSFADLSETNLSLADLSGANLRDADLNRAHLSFAHLSGADLSFSHLREANLSGADLSRAHLSGANLSGANLSLADLSRARIGWTTFGGCDLQGVKGLDQVHHEGPSHVSINTIGNIPEVFLRGIGTPALFLQALITKPIKYSPCFISYSHKDAFFAQRLSTDLQRHGFRCWFAPHSMKPGDALREQMNEALHIYDKLILLLSEHAVKSTWVSFEVEAVMSKEHKGKPLVLFPLRLDQAIMESTTAWAQQVKRTRHIGNFAFWKNVDAYQKGLQRLLLDLKQGCK